MIFSMPSNYIQLVINYVRKKSMFRSLSSLFILCFSFFFTQPLYSFFQANNLSSDPPIVEVKRDDHVATIEMDYDESAGYGGLLWNVGTDGTDPVGYYLEWWPDPSDTADMVMELGCPSDKSAGTLVVGTAEAPHHMISINPMVQIQPLANDVTYHLKVTKVNSKGEFCSLPTELVFEGGDGSRVAALRSSLTFFDDFNLPMGPPDELKWNNAMTPQTDPRFNLFFINPQCHTHTLAGTLTGAAGDKSQVAQRARKPILIEEDLRRRIVFDMDGIFSPRSVWYLDLNPVKTDLTGHMSFFDNDGDTGLPADVFRIKAQRNEIFVHLINSEGELFNVASADLPDYGRRMSTNVRRAFDVRLGTDGVEIFVDGTSVLNATFPQGAFKPGVYDLLWSTIGYNTSKDDNPYFLSHWDNFGFDGPNIEPFRIHNYVTRINGTDLQKANRRGEQSPTFTVNVPDDIRPLEAGVTNEVWLVFTYMKNDFSQFNIVDGDYLLFNGNTFPLPEGANNSSPLVPYLVNYAGSTISNRIKIGEVEMGGNSPLNIGDNTIQFFAENTGIVNLHIEVQIPEDATPPPYTPPSQIHPFNLHGGLPKLGPPAKIVNIAGEQLTEDDEGNLEGPQLSGEVALQILAGNDHWAAWGPHLLMTPAASAEFWSAGSSKGISKVELFIKPRGNDTLSGFVIASLNTDADVPAPQVRYELSIDTRLVSDGEYELYTLATDINGIKSHPSYSGVGFKFDASEFSGAYFPVYVTISNGSLPAYTFNGSDGNLWTDDTSWDTGQMPPMWYNGPITIEASCEVPEEYILRLGGDATLVVAENVNLTIK